MLVDVVLLGITAGIAALAYARKRLAGVLILAAMAGALLAVGTGQTAADWLTTHGLTISYGSPRAIASVAITLVPALVLLIFGPKGGSGLRRTIGAVVLGGISAALVAQYAADIFAGNILASSHLPDIFAKWHTDIIAGGLVYALADIFLGISGGGKPEKGKK